MNSTKTASTTRAATPMIRAIKPQRKTQATSAPNLPPARASREVIDRVATDRLRHPALAMFPKPVLGPSIALSRPCAR